MARALRGIMGRAARLFTGRASTVDCPECCEEVQHYYCHWCPCDQLGCWDQRPQVWIRDDVTCTDGVTKVCLLNPYRPDGAPVLIRLNGWCYHQGVGGLTQTPPPPGPGVVIIEPPSQVQCVTPQPQPGGGICSTPICVPEGFGDCVCPPVHAPVSCPPTDPGCACHEVCMEVGMPAGDECPWCCGGVRALNGDGQWGYVYSLREVARVINSPWCPDCETLGSCAGETERHIRTITAESLTWPSAGGGPGGCRPTARFRIHQEHMVRSPFVNGCVAQVTVPPDEFVEEDVSYAGPLPAFTLPLRNLPSTGGVEDCSFGPVGPCPQPACSDQECFNCFTVTDEHDKCRWRRYTKRFRVATDGLAGCGCCRRVETYELVEELRYVPAGAAGGCCTRCLMSLCGIGEGGPSGGMDCEPTHIEQPADVPGGDFSGGF
jgi:hypothetical protein